jgi:hypothetical protein
VKFDRGVKRTWIAFKLIVNMRFLKSFYLLFLFLFYSGSCHPLRHQQSEDDYLPDLKIKDLRYSFIYYERTDPDHVPQRVMELHVKDLEIYITIENIGTADWAAGLCIYYNLDQDREQGIISIEDLEIPYASQSEVFFTLNCNMRRPKTATIILNPADTDSTEGCIRIKEAFYNNNIYLVKFN